MSTPPPPTNTSLGDISLPAADAYQEGELVQWWYWVGHLTAEDGARYAFQLVFFAGQLLGCVRGQMAQHALAELDTNQWHDGQLIWPWGPKVLPNRFELATPTGDIMASGGGGQDTLHTDIDGFTLDLTVEQQRAPVIHYKGLRHTYAFGGNTYYYSRALMRAQGTLRTPAGQTLAVSGQVWFDRQYGELVQAVLVGWQWFAIQLDDDTEIMLFNFNQQPEELYGSITGPDGVTHDLHPGDYTTDVFAWWRSPETGHNYPAGWRIGLPGGAQLIVKPQMSDQEMAGCFWVGPRYWEGACDVTDTTSDRKGLAYVELVGFSKRSGW
jgi:predicted secreted hydrolase